MSAATEPAPDPKAAPRAMLPRIVFFTAFGLVLLLAAVLATARYGVLLPQTRLLIEARVEGLKIGRMGRLKIEGLQGDVWRDLTVRRLTVADEKGIWLEARNLRLKWRYPELLRRRFRADRVSAEEVRILRRPMLTPKGGVSRGMPVSFHIDELSARLAMEPAFSGRRGVYDLKAALDVERRGGQSGKVQAASVLHPGDHLTAEFNLGGLKPMRFVADATEAKGGALAGSLGLPADQPFALSVRASGKMSEGRFTAVATSGSRTPLWARGAWSPQGGQAGGRLLLTSSRLTEGYARRFGPQATFGIAGRRAGPSNYALEARVAAANLGVVARGFGDLGKRQAGPGGVVLALSTPDLGRIAGRPDLGPTQAKGVLKGQASDWRFAGDWAVQRAAIWGYAVSRASGPLEVSRRRGAINFQTRLAGTGGTGQGLVPALMGATPRAELEGSRLADGRLLIRRLDVDGAGLKVEASGDRGLLGGLSFRGKAEVSNLPAARMGASGVVAGGWSAVQARAGEAWTFTVDARGAKFATGFSELDRLLGSTPKLDGAASLKDGMVLVSRARLDGAALQATGAGQMARGGALQFKIDWTAQGPFRAGPVEITGRAKGDGAIGGRLSEPRLDLLADFEAIDVPRLPLRNAHLTLSFLRQADGSSGKATLAAESAYGPAKASTDFAFPRGGVDLSDLALDAGGVKASGALSLRRGAPSAADLKVAVGPGAFLEGGRIIGAVKITDGTNGTQARLDLNAQNALIRGAPVGIATGRLTANGPWARLPYEIQAKGASRGGPWEAAGRGMLLQDASGRTLSFDGSGKAGRRDLRTTEPAVFRFGGKERGAKLRLTAAGGGRIALDAVLGERTAEVRAQVTRLGLTDLDEDLTGLIDANLTLQGQGAQLAGTLDAKVDGARARGSAAATGLDGTVRARLSGDQLVLDAAATGAEGLRSQANLVLPAEATAAPFRVAIARQRPLRGRFTAEGEIKPLWDLLIGGERSLAGRVSTEATLSGTLADPAATGRASVDGGRFDDGATGLSLRDVTLRANFANRAIDVTEAKGIDGHGGTAAGSGRISLLREGVSSFRLDLTGFRLIDNDIATASASGQATINRAADGKVRLAGALTIDRADVAANPPVPANAVPMAVVERNRPMTLNMTLPPPPKRGDGWALDVTLKAPRRVFLRGRGLDLELSLDARVTGTSSNPTLNGVARVVRGDYDFAGKRFEFDDRGAIYLASRARDIRLDLTATREDPALTAVVRIRGTAAKPEIALTSTPVLPNDEVLSQVLFGRSASQLSPLEAAQLASALSALAGGGGLDVIGNLRAFARLDRLSFGGGESGVTVSGGKYLTEDVYLELTGGGREGPTAEVEWRIGRRLSILSRLAGQGEGRLAVRWRRDY